LFKNYIKLYNQLCKIKFFFNLPEKKKILLYDDTNLWVLKKITNEKFNILKTREEKEIYFWILIKQIIFFDFKFTTYCKNYIKFTTPKIVITFIDTNIDFYQLKNSFVNTNFISIQNGTRTPDWFESHAMKKAKNLSCDHIFVFNKFLKFKYSNYINSKIHIIGNYKNNMVNISETRNYNQFLIISEFEKDDKKKIIFQKKLLYLINLYICNSNIKINILLKSKNDLNQKKEIEFYKKIFKSNCSFIKSLEWNQSYKIIDKFENIIFMYSTLGYEAISRKKKIAVFSPDRIKGFNYYFGWPANSRIAYNFFSTKKVTYNEIKRVLNNVINCSQANWQNAHYTVIKDQMYLDKNNSKLKKVLLRLI